MLQRKSPIRWIDLTRVRTRQHTKTTDAQLIWLSRLNLLANTVINYSNTAAYRMWFTLVTFMAIPSGRFLCIYSKKVSAVDPVICLIWNENHTRRPTVQSQEMKNLCLLSVSQHTLTQHWKHVVKKLQMCFRTVQHGSWIIIEYIYPL